MNALVTKFISLPIFLMVIVGGVIVTSVAGVSALAVTSTSTSITLQAEAVTADTANTTVDNEVFTKSSAVVSAAGTCSASPVTATIATFAAVNDALAVNDWVYQFDVKEAGNNTWVASQKYKIEVYGDGALLTTLHLTMPGTVDTLNPEGVTAKVSLGATSVPDNTSVQVTKY